MGMCLSSIVSLVLLIAVVCTSVAEQSPSWAKLQFSVALQASSAAMHTAYLMNIQLLQRMMLIVPSETAAEGCSHYGEEYTLL